MISWFFHIIRNNYDDHIELSNNETIQINETDFINISVSIPSDYFVLGEPYLLVGDVPLELELISSNDLVRKFKTIDHNDFYRKQIFYNYFGESEILLCFQDGRPKNLFSIKVDVRARKANAELARDMISFISQKMDDAVLLCFSKSHIGIGNQESEVDKLTRYKLLEETIKQLISQQVLFVRDHRTTWEHKLKLSSQGAPSGIDSVHYLLNHLDKVVPADSSNTNILIKNRMFRLELLPSEELVTKSDVFENRVIYSFLFSAKHYLHKLKIQSEGCITSYSNSPVYRTDISNDYVTFDNVLHDYKIEIIKHHIDSIFELSKQVDYLINLYRKHIKTKLIPQLRPKMTPFVATRPHYREAFTNIHNWYSSNAPDLDGDSFLMGLRNLSTIYEITCLLILNEVIKKDLGFEYISSSFIHYGETFSYQGVECERPSDKPNNYFQYENGDTKVSIRYEPKIYQYRKNISQSSDLINVSNKRSGKFGQHYYCPDYVITFKNLAWDSDLVVIMDAKYQSHENVMKYSLVETEHKYLREIYSVKENMSVGVSPIKLLILLYAHGSGNIASKLHRQHRLGEELSILPQALGMKIAPDMDSRELLSKYLNIILESHLST